MDSSTLDALCGSFATDEAAMIALQEFSNSIQSEFPTILETCVRTLVWDSDVHATTEGSASLKRGLDEWVRSLRAPRDREYRQCRREDGRCHCAIGLPRELVIAAFGRFREQLLVRAMSWPQVLEGRADVIRAINRELDFDLTLVLQGYVEFEEHRQFPTDQHSSAVAHLSASIGHELRNPLGTIETSAYLIAQRLIRLEIADDVIDRHLEKVRKYVQLCSRRIGDLQNIQEHGTEP